jgi:hypothetical protein
MSETRTGGPDLLSIIRGLLCSSRCAPKRTSSVGSPAGAGAPLASSGAIRVPNTFGSPGLAPLDGLSDPGWHHSTGSALQE